MSESLKPLIPILVWFQQQAMPVLSSDEPLAFRHLGNKLSTDENVDKGA